MIHRKVGSIEIGAASVSFELEGEARTLPAKQVIIAMGAQPDDALQAKLTTSGVKVHRIGDCREIGYIDGAILDARKLVQTLS